MNILYQFAATQSDAGGSGLLESLGINWGTLAFQALAFLLLVWVLGKWVYPIFMGIVDKRQADIADSTKAADKARALAAQADTETSKLLQQARAEAGEIVASAREEAAAGVAAAEAKAKARAEAIIASAQAQTEKDRAAAQKELYNEAADLVALATEKVLGSAITEPVDAAVITSALQEAQS